jgi:hypothetical protein
MTPEFSACKASAIGKAYIWATIGQTTKAAYIDYTEDIRTIITHCWCLLGDLSFDLQKQAEIVGDAAFDLDYDYISATTEK